MHSVRGGAESAQEFTEEEGRNERQKKLLKHCKENELNHFQDQEFFVKTYFLSVCCLGFLLISAPVFSAVQVFGPASRKFSLDIPKGWNAYPSTNGCQLISPDKHSSLAITLQENTGMTTEDVAKSYVKNMGKVKYSIKNTRKGQSVLLVDMNDFMTKIIITEIGNEFFIVNIAGTDENAMNNVLRTLKIAK